MEDKDWSRVDVQREVVAVLQKVVRDARLAFEQAALECLQVTAANKRENREVRRLRQARDKAERTYIGLSRALERELKILLILDEELTIKRNKGAAN